MAVGVLCALFAGVFSYVDQHFFNEETFLANTASLADDVEIREHLFASFRDEIDVQARGDEPDEGEEDRLGNLLGQDDADSDSDPFTEERIAQDQAIERLLLDLFESEEYDQVFTQAMVSTRQQIVRTAELEPAARLRDSGEITFNMQRLYEKLHDAMKADPLTVEITRNPVPEGFAILPVADRETTIEPLWTLIRNGPNWRSLTTALAVLSLIGAIVIAERRPSIAIQFGLGTMGLAIVVIVIVFLIRFIVPVLTSGGSSGAVVATYVANTAPLIAKMIRLVVLGGILASVGGIARLIWPDDWVYGTVSDDRGVRSIMRRRGAPEAQAQPVQQQAAAAPVGYPAYGQYPGYPPQQPWGQYPGQYPPGYPAPYPAGPYAQPAQPGQQAPQHYATPGRPTVPVMPVPADPRATLSPDLVPPAAPPLDPDPIADDLPNDAAGVVPRVVAAETMVGEPTAAVSSVEVEPEAEPSSSEELIAEAKAAASDATDADDWAADQDW